MPRYLSKPKIGDQFDRLTIEDIIYIHVKGIYNSVRKRYLCRCSCGNIRETDAWRLRNGTHKSCGCLQEEGFKTGWKHVPNRNNKISMSLKIQWQNPEIAKKRIDGIRTTHNKPEVRAASSERTKILWQDPNYVANVRKHSKQNKAEVTLEQILQSIYKNEYKFVGDGKFVLDGLNPDFLCDRKRKIIECFGEPWHDPKHGVYSVKPKATEEVRKKIFRKAGYQTLIVWFKELKDIEKLKKKIKKFHEAPPYKTI